jgi:hypothetical protein
VIAGWLVSVGSASIPVALHTICSRSSALWDFPVYGRWTFNRLPEAEMLSQLKTRSYGVLFVVVGALAATGGNFKVR